MRSAKHHKFDDYSTIEEILKNTKIPPMFKVRQHFNNDKIDDVAAETRKQLVESGVEDLVTENMRICLTGSSRGIANMNIVLRETASFFKDLGCIPFIIPAMGSHGGATVQGQMEILKGYGITEEFCGCPIISSMETVRLGYVEEDGEKLEVRIDKTASEADGIVVINRIKPHSAFRGPYESGLMKMLCIGLGKQEGADSLHRDGFGVFKTRIPLYGNFVRTHSKVLFGLGVIENAYDETNKIAVLRNEEIPEKEPELLKYAASLMPRVLVDETDVMVVRELGKDFSGSGMDPNISGTWSTPYGGGGLKHQKTAVLDLSELSYGNGLGVGQADTITLRFYNKLDFMEMYPNALTNTVFLPIKMAMVLRDDEMAIKGAIKTCNHFDPKNPKIVFFKNTSKMDEIYLSKAFWEEAKTISGLEILSEPEQLPFDKGGNLLIWNE
ncbi:MAG: hypothetical protein PHR92_01680 [Lachnospiraceae bacterium]|nr:hypothetical protein [Lachnospiraceae bacterium]